MTFYCSYGKYQYIRLPFGAAPAGNLFQNKIHKLLNYIPNVFGIAGDILIAGFDAYGRDYDIRVEQVLCRCRQANLKLKKEKSLFR